MSNWGLTPSAARALLRKQEWGNRQRLKQRLLGERALPLLLALKPPSAKQALADMEALRQFVAAWKDYSGPGTVQWQTQNFRQTGEQQLATHLALHSLEQLFQFLGKDVVQAMRALEEKLQPLLAVDRGLKSVLINNLPRFDELSPLHTQQLAALLPQLKKGLGSGCYLRALPLSGIHSKFIEQQQSLIEDILNVWFEDELRNNGGLLPWLNCRDNPRGWLLVRPLCEHTRRELAGMPLLQLDSATLQQRPLPGKNILVVENLQSGLGLPTLEHTVAVCGGGKNLAWMHNRWMNDRRAGYWGDLDSHGLAMLDQALEAQPQVTPLLMDRAVFAAFPQNRSQDSKPCQQSLSHLPAEQQALYQQLLREDPTRNRLEQELIDSDTIHREIQAWAATSI